LGNSHGISVVIMVINVVICRARVSRPTSCKPRVLYKLILMEDLYLEFIFFICFINLLLYIYDHVSHDDDDGKSPSFSHINGLFEQNGISLI